MNKQGTIERSIGLAGATGVGIGAMVGGGILALAGVAYATTGPATLAVFAANGVIAILTALSFAEMSTAFPQSGGTYTFAKNVLSVRAAFAFGWVGWFASIVAGVLYAMGFASYAAIALQECGRLLFGIAPEWLVGQAMVATLAICATAYYTFGLIRTSGGGDNWINFAKMIVFAVLIGGGLWALTGRSLTAIHTSLTPFLTHGTAGFFQAMGYTFIVLQGFDLIAAVAGEVRAPERTLPRAMLLSLAAALGVYLPLLFVIATVGVPPGQTIGALSAKHPEVVVALAARHFLGETGFWLVLVAAILSMLSALQANLLAASRVALTMAQDRTLPAPIGEVHIRYKTPITAICVSALTMATLLLVVPDVAAASAAASLIFLISFAMTHWTSILARTRRRTPAPFHTPFFPLVPVTGGLCCAGLALFQAVSVPTAGLVSAVWLGLGGLLYWALLARRARVVDASAEALDPQLLQMRGRSPLVLVPVANPQNASAMVAVAHALAPPGVGRVLLLSVVAAPKEEWREEEPPRSLHDTQTVLREAVTASFAAELAPEALMTIAPQPWPEIVRVSRAHRCESLLLGLSDVNSAHLEELISSVACDVVVLHTPPGWQLKNVHRVLVPTRSLGAHDKFRARLLGSLCRTGNREVTFLQVLPEHATDFQCDRAQRRLMQFANEEVPTNASALVVRHNKPLEEITRQANNSDLVVLGLERLDENRRQFGQFAPILAQNINCATIMISRRG